MKQPDEQPGRRNRRRATGAEVSHAVFDRTRSYRHLRNPFEPLKVFSDDQVSAIHDAALVMLETQVNRRDQRHHRARELYSWYEF